jgi:S1-C subfamily serine protease
MLAARTALPCPFPRREAMTSAVTLVLFSVLAAADDPMVLEFTTANCPACRKTDPVVRGLAQQGFPIRQIDSAQSKLVQQFHVRGYPTFVLVSGGREVSRIEGAASREKLIGLLKPAESSASPKGGTPASEMLVRGQSPGPRSRTDAASPAQAALAATVRLRVNEGATDGIGTGTIIDTHYNEEHKAEEALIVTCGHIFRESQGKGKITVEIFTPQGIRKVEGSLLDFDDKRDVALVTVWPGVQVAVAEVAPKDFVVRPQDPAFTVGCSNGQDPTVVESRITAVNRFLSKPNYTAAVSPPEGRSGGGLFSADGHLIGICNASIQDENQGLYASLPSIHGQLDKFNLGQIYQRAAVSNAVEPAAGTVALASAELPTAAPRNDLPARPAPSRDPMPNPSGLPHLPQQMPRAAPLAADSVETAAGDDIEVVVIVRSKQRPESSSEIYLVDNASPDLVSSITTAARASAQARAVARQNQPADRLARQNQANEQPVVRGQFK